MASFFFFLKRTLIILVLIYYDEIKEFHVSVSFLMVRLLEEGHLHIWLRSVVPAIFPLDRATVLHPLAFQRCFWLPDPLSLILMTPCVESRILLTYFTGRGAEC